MLLISKIVLEHWLIEVDKLLIISSIQLGTYTLKPFSPFLIHCETKFLQGHSETLLAGQLKSSHL